jgi:hypothetical protein
VELTGAEREELGDTMAGFRAALSAEDQELIAAMRDKLLSLLGGG